MTKLLPINTRVKLIYNPEITGIITEHRNLNTGKLSILPYKIKWDDERAARKIIGSLYCCPPPRYLEKIKDE